jgi:NAD(P)-dependent dehydrogenase (short-subunit alcohol dehydrogenase family)
MRVVVTGAAGGIGSAVASELASRGADLALVGRRTQPLEALASRLAGGPHRVVTLDVTDESAWVRSLGELTPEGELHGLVTAAAVLSPVGPIGTWKVDDFRRAYEVNVLGTLLPIVALRNSLEKAKGSVVTFSGGGATSPLPRYDAYATSKAAVVRLTENLAAELSERGVRVNCVAPGFVATAIHQATLDAGPSVVGESYYEKTVQSLKKGDSPELTARLTAFLLSDESTGITGRLISAVWDPWEDGAFVERLRTEKDFATLRRIDGQFFVPAHP